ncbi:MAG: hypothetical protein L3J82_00850 [Planctomycetes bacterium]|nr:hypothetical protein [Planctomycetota bacterium]
MPKYKIVLPVAVVAMLLGACGGGPQYADPVDKLVPNSGSRPRSDPPPRETPREPPREVKETPKETPPPRNLTGGKAKIADFVDEVAAYKPARVVGCIPLPCFDDNHDGAWVAELGVTIANMVAEQLEERRDFKGVSMSPREMETRLNDANLGRSTLKAVEAVYAVGERFGTDVVVFGTIRKLASRGVNGPESIDIDLGAYDIITKRSIAETRFSMLSNSRDNTWAYTDYRATSLWEVQTQSGSEEAITKSTLAKELRVAGRVLGMHAMRSMEPFKGSMFVPTCDVSAFLEASRDLRSGQKIFATEYQRRVGTEIEVQGRGAGITREKALRDARRDAIAQALGVQKDTLQEFKETVIESIEGEEKSLKFKSDNTENDVEHVSGRIGSYREVSVKKDPDVDAWVAIIDAKVEKGLHAKSIDINGKSFADFDDAANYLTELRSNLIAAKSQQTAATTSRFIAEAFLEIAPKMGVKRDETGISNINLMHLAEGTIAMKAFENDDLRKLLTVQCIGLVASASIEKAGNDVSIRLDIYYLSKGGEISSTSHFFIQSQFVDELNRILGSEK